MTTTRFISSDPGSRQAIEITTDSTLPEVEVDMEGYVACLDASQVSSLVSQLVTWLGARAQ